MKHEDEQRRVVAVTAAPHMIEGEGFEVRRPVPADGLEAVGPFIMLDHMGPVMVAPGKALGTPTHPHAGFETLSYLLEGRAHHLDSLGNSSAMGHGEVQWMRAGRGIVHDEGPDDEFRRDGGRLHGLQLWINLPRGHKHDEPLYRHFRADEIPVVEHSPGASSRLVAGTLGEAVGPLSTFSAPFLAHLTLTAGSTALLAPPAGEFAAYVMVGGGRVGETTVGEGDMARLAGTGSIAFTAGASGLETMLFGGSPLDAPIVRYGPFVMNSREELREVVEAYQRGSFGRIERRAA